MQTSDSYSLHR